MLIVVGLDRAEEVAPLVRAGASEFYAGIVPRSWSEKYSYSVSPNRRETKRPNLTSYKEFSNLVSSVHAAGKRVHATVNAHDYPSIVLDDIKSLVENVIASGADGIIVADIGLLLKLKEWRIETTLILSGDFGLWNSAGVKLVEQLNPAISRIILPRHMTIAEMKSIIKHHPHLEYETFILNERCFFSSAHCFAIHGKRENNYCTELFDDFWRIEANEGFSFDDYEAAANNIFWVKRREQINFSCNLNDMKPYNAVPCGLCALAKLKDIGIKYVKVVGRGVEADFKLLMVDLVNTVLQTEPPPEEITRIYADTFGSYYREMCSYGYNCYYGEM